MKWILLMWASLAFGASAPDTVCRTVSSTAGEMISSQYRSESSLLTTANLHLRDEVSVRDWERSLNKFMAENRDNPEVQKLVKEFVLDFANHPPGDYLPGDWPVRRDIRDWRLFFRQRPNFYVKPAFFGYFLQTPVGDMEKEAPRIITASQLDRHNEGSHGLFGVVERTLQNHYALLEARGMRTSEAVADARTNYLQRTMLAEAYRLYLAEENRNQTPVQAIGNWLKRFTYN